MTIAPPTTEQPFKGPVVDAAAAAEVGAEYLEVVGKVIASHVRNELAGASVFDEPAIALAPTPREKWLACRIAMEEYGHHLKFQRLATDLGLPVHQGQPLSVFEFELTTWVEFVVLKAIVDLAEVVLMDELVECSYLPLRHLAQALMPEERFHVSFGAVRTKELARQPARRAEVQEAVNALVTFSLPFFGRSRSTNNDAFRRWGIKNRTNDQARAEFIERTRAFVVDDAGLEYPDVSASWDGR
ncbi:MAG TPA: Phenylacetic acid catabolic protein [Acidimicrobiales bacterium]|nr:Phenylacetic acid catabolic protein [Acidimicrobiales bacterium]